MAPGTGQRHAAVDATRGGMHRVIGRLMVDPDQYHYLCTIINWVDLMPKMSYSWGV